MKTKRASKAWLVITLCIVVASIILTTGNYYFSKISSKDNDYFIQWMGFRNFFQEGISPYSDEGANRINSAIASQSSPDQPLLSRFVSPLYSIILLGPFALIRDYAISRAIWMTILELCLLGIALISIRLAEWRPKNWILIIFFAFSFIWFQGLISILNADIVVFVGLGIAASLLAISQGHDEFAGFLLGLITVKPSVSIVFILFIVFWALVQRRKKIVLWLFITLILLGVAASVLIPDWTLQYFHVLMQTTEKTGLSTPSNAIIHWWPSTGGRVGTVISIITIAILAVEWWLARKTQSQRFLWTACLTIVASQWVGIPTNAGNFIILLPILPLIFISWHDRWKGVGNVLTLGFMVLLGFGLWVLYFALHGSLLDVYFSPALIFPLPLLLLLLLYWVRWWVIRPPTVWYEKVAQDIGSKQG